MSRGKHAPEQKVSGKHVAAVLAVASVLVFGLMSTPTSASNIQQEMAKAGLNCNMTDKENGGFVLDCDPMEVTPSPVSPSPSTPTTSPSPSPTSPGTASPSPTPSSTPAPTSSSPTPTATSPSPSPSTSTPGTPTTRNCFDNLAACGYPTTTTTGVPAGTVLTVRGNLTINSPNTIWQNLDIQGCVDINATGVILRNSKITCPGGTGINTEDVRGGSSYANNVQLSHVEVTCVNAKGSGIWGRNFDARSVYVHDCENGFEVNDWSRIIDSYIVAREATSDGHGDDIQSQDGNNVLVQHNTFAGLNPITSSIITNPTLNNGWIVENNFLSAGAYTLYCPEEGKNWVVRNNRFYPAKTGNSHSAAFGLTDECNDPNIAWSGNYRDDNGAVVNP
jgi:hypothetical protein